MLFADPPKEVAGSMLVLVTNPVQPLLWTIWKAMFRLFSEDTKAS
jgi:hypothetical protein